MSVLTPERSTAAAVAAGAAGNIVMAVIRQFVWPEAPESMEGWVTTVLMALVMHFVADAPPSSGPPSDPSHP